MTIIHSLEPAPDPLRACEALEGLPFRLFLDSAVRGARSRYSFLCADPVAVLVADGHGVGRHDPAEGHRVALKGGALAAAADELARFRAAPVPGLPPFQGGLAGFLSYELSRRLEVLPLAPADDVGVPDMHLAVYDWVLAWDHELNRAWVISTGIPEPVGETREARAGARLAEVLGRLRGAGIVGTREVPGRMRGAGAGRAEPAPAPECSLSRAGYMAAVERVRGLIQAGDLFQANVTRRIAVPVHDDPWTLYLRLRELSPAPFAAYLEAGALTIASASPERFVTVDAAGHVETRPIKGTRPRGITPADDARLATELLESGKDRAENLMIVDLMRNDLSRVCEPGSVRVTELYSLERSATVQHLVSAVAGTLEAGRNATDLLEATFPPGSITGAPKVRAMEVIAELEPVTRGVYCGAIGYLSVTGAADMSVAIRTCTIAGDTAWCAAGGGIVLDSDPAAEYAETEDKARAMLSALAPARVEAGTAGRA